MKQSFHLSQCPDFRRHLSASKIYVAGHRGLMDRAKARRRGRVAPLEFTAFTPTYGAVHFKLPSPGRERWAIGPSKLSGNGPQPLVQGPEQGLVAQQRCGQQAEAHEPTASAVQAPSLKQSQDLLRRDAQARTVGRAIE